MNFVHEKDCEFRGVRTECSELNTCVPCHPNSYDEPPVQWRLEMRPWGGNY